ncbi:hypothetical protein AGMMS49942_14510 [Spirochaetia bacterium]|nr:hypothetical protein AGMMS49942_14510 [Spirochaetia bacterium]
MKRINHGLIVGLAVLLLAAVSFVGCENVEGTIGPAGADGAKGDAGDSVKGNPGKDYVPPAFAPPASVPVAATWTLAEYYLVAKNLPAVVYSGAAEGTIANRYIPAGKTVYLAAGTLAGIITLADTAHLVVYGGAVVVPGAATIGILGEATDPTTVGKITVETGGSITTDSASANAVSVKEIVLNGGNLTITEPAVADQVKTKTLTVRSGAKVDVALSTGAGTLVATTINVTDGTLIGPTATARLTGGTKAVTYTTLTGTAASTFESAVNNAAGVLLFEADVPDVYTAGFGTVKSTGATAPLIGIFNVPVNRSFVIAGAAVTPVGSGVDAELAFTGSGDVFVTGSYTVNSNAGTNQAFSAILSLNGPTLYAGSIRVKASVPGTVGKFAVLNANTSAPKATFAPGKLTMGKESSGAATNTTLNGLTITFKKGATGVGESAALLNNTASTGTERVVFEEGSIVITNVLGTGLPIAAPIGSAAAGSYKPDSTTATWTKVTP